MWGLGPPLAPAPSLRARMLGWRTTSNISARAFPPSPQLQVSTYLLLHVASAVWISNGAVITCDTVHLAYQLINTVECLSFLTAVALQPMHVPTTIRVVKVMTHTEKDASIVAAL